MPPPVADCKNNTAAEEQKQLALLVMETLTVLLQGFNNTNAGKAKVPKEYLASGYYAAVLIKARWSIKFNSNAAKVNQEVAEKQLRADFDLDKALLVLSS